MGWMNKRRKGGREEEDLSSLNGALGPGLQAMLDQCIFIFQLGVCQTGQNRQMRLGLYSWVDHSQWFSATCVPVSNHSGIASVNRPEDSNHANSSDESIDLLQMVLIQSQHIKPSQNWWVVALVSALKLQLALGVFSGNVCVTFNAHLSHQESWVECFSLNHLLRVRPGLVLAAAVGGEANVPGYGLTTNT